MGGADAIADLILSLARARRARVLTNIPGTRVTLSLTAAELLALVEISINRALDGRVAARV